MLSKQEPPTVRFVAMDATHLDDVAEVHLEAFRGFFLSLLGRRFLRLFYREVLRSPGHAAFAAVTPTGSVVGFVAGAADQASLYRYLLRRRWFAFALASLGAACRHPSILARLWRAVWRPRDARSAKTAAVLMSLAVDPRVRQKGVGRRLVSHFLESMARQQVDAVSLTTDRDDNDEVNRFYRRIGFSRVRQYCTPEGRWMNEYLLEMAPRSARGAPSTPRLLDRAG